MKSKWFCKFEGCPKKIAPNPSNGGLCPEHQVIRFCEVEECSNRIRVDNRSGLCQKHNFKRPNHQGDLAKKRDRQRRWAKNNPEAVHAGTLRYRARKRNAFIEDIDFSFVWERDEGVCCICNEPADPDNWWLEHKIPISRGGLHCYENVGVSHPECNQRKSSKLLEELDYQIGRAR